MNWFLLDRNGIVKSCDPSKFWLTERRFVRIYDNDLSGYKSEATLERFSFFILINLFTVSWNQLESHDFTIPLRSNGNQDEVLNIIQKLQLNITIKWSV